MVQKKLHSNSIARHWLLLHQLRTLQDVVIITWRCQCTPAFANLVFTKTKTECWLMCLCKRGKRKKDCGNKNSVLGLLASQAKKQVCIHDISCSLNILCQSLLFFMNKHCFEMYSWIPDYIISSKYVSQMYGHLNVFQFNFGCHL